MNLPVCCWQYVPPGTTGPSIFRYTRLKIWTSTSNKGIFPFFGISRATPKHLRAHFGLEIYFEVRVEANWSVLHKQLPLSESAL